MSKCGTMYVRTVACENEKKKHVKISCKTFIRLTAGKIDRSCISIVSKNSSLPSLNYLMVLNLIILIRL